MSFLLKQLSGKLNKRISDEGSNQVYGPASASKKMAASSSKKTCASISKKKSALALKKGCASVSKKCSNQRQKPTTLHITLVKADNLTGSEKPESNNLSQFKKPAVSKKKCFKQINEQNNAKESTISSFKPPTNEIKSIVRSSPWVSSEENNAGQVVIKTLRNVKIPRLPIYKCPDFCEEYDEDLEFFRSLKTWVRQFNDDEKLKFRLGVMKTVERIRAAKSDSDNYVVLSRMPL